MKALLSAIFFSAILIPEVYAQPCTPLDTAVQTPLVLDCTGGTTNRSGVAWNPIDSLYYSCNAGSASYPFETFSSTGGAPVSSTTGGISWRGLWWNPSLSQVEGNAFSSGGWFIKDLDVTGYALSTNTNILTGQMQPNTQSCGDLDYDNNEVIFYDLGSIYRYDRATGASLGSYTLNGIPGGTLSDYGVVYTGCPGQEIGVYDYTNNRVYLFDKSNGNFVVSIPLPATAPVITTFRVSYANGLFWLFDSNTNTWVSFQLFSSCTASTATDTIVACESYTWIDSVTYTASNTTATQTLVNSLGCDSIVTLNLTILQPSSATDIVTACGSYTWIDGITYTASNTTATDTLVNASGCDSIVTLNLTINPFPSATVSQVGTTLTADQTGAQYQWLDCDSSYAIISGETGQSYTPAITGNYAVEVGLNGCSDTSACTIIDYTGIDDLSPSQKELVKIVDVMGRETTFKPNTVLIYIYSDGTMERTMKLEE